MVASLGAVSFDLLNVLPIVSARAGGPPAFVGPAARELERLGHRVRTIATDLALAPGARPQRRVLPDEVQAALAAAGHHTLYPTRFPRRLLYSPELARGARTAAATASVVHLHSLWLHPQYAGYRAAAAAGVPYIVSPHGALDPALATRGRLRKRLTTDAWQRRMLDGARMIHITTDVEAELIADIARAVPRALVPVGVDLDEFDDLPERDVFRRTRLGGYDGPVVLFLSRLSYKKGIDLLIEGFAHVRRRLESRLVIAGPDDERLTPSLRGVAARHGVLEDVQFVGPVFGEDRRAAFASADLWALTSHTENFGVAVIEAMAARRPVVISPAVNLAPQVAAADAGLVAELNPVAIADAIQAVLSDPARSHTLGRNGRKFAERFDWPIVASELERMYLGASA